MQSNGDVKRELRLNRQNTRYFISMEPSCITLTPRQEIDTPSGGTDTIDFDPRPEQTFKLIRYHGGSPSDGGPSQAEDGQARRFDYVLLGEWDAVVEVGDWWQDGDQRYEVVGILPYNEYETKAGVISYGFKPSGDAESSRVQL